MNNDEAAKYAEETLNMGLNLGVTATAFYTAAAQALREIRPLKETITSWEITMTAYGVEIEAWKKENTELKARIAELEKRWEGLELFVRTTPGLNRVLHEIERMEGL
jgi:phage shock protein A